MTNQAGIRLAVIDTDSSLPHGPRQAPRGRRLGAPRARRQRSRRRARGDEAERPAGRPLGARPAGLGVPRAGLRRDPRPRRARLHRRSRPSPSGSAGLRLGADDWIGKPCHPEEVMARIEAVVRRRKRAAAREDVGPLVSGELEIRPDQYQAFVSGQSIGLTRREFELLAAARRGARPGDRARGDLPEGLGLRDGPRRSLRRRLRAQAAPEAPAPLARTGATSTRTSGSATASIPSRSARWSSRSCRLVERAAR